VGEIESNVIDNARPGGIVELHDGGGDRSQTLAALPDIITTLRRRGYRFVTVTQLLGLRPIYR
jgi:peptidoglycan/xylan/chitin deacetylase (PgdA/CDA1 family)